MPKKQKPDARLSEIKDRFLERAAELWEAHEGEFMAVLNDAENNKVNLTFAGLLDFSESTAKLETTIRFSQVVKDKKTDDFDDPNQPRLPLEPEADGEADGKPKRGGRRGKSNKRSDAITGKEAAAGAGVDER